MRRDSQITVIVTLIAGGEGKNGLTVVHTMSKPGRHGGGGLTNKSQESILTDREEAVKLSLECEFEA